ncbi:hypothetical protein HK103_002083 [Boothiomyces macroporosus]|uniref:SGNH hydrolase-type esterase domain-containing protein n=1 Tax=Boothiomyces macroporosus TaxID=261099 RepID=A0AAD5Y0I5_9FUNG|nr:hypothetical protein HK103_002083 [Boothiomyces macroporosus]
MTENQDIKIDSKLISLKMNKILLIGDSITQCGSDPSMLGWAASLQHHYIRKLEIVNKGLSGYNTGWVEPLMDGFLDYCELGDSRIVLTIIMLGTNDSVHPSVNSLQAVDVEAYKANLTEICGKALQRGQVLLVTPPPANQHPERTLERTRRYKDAAMQVAHDLSIPCLDTWHALLGDGSNLDKIWDHYYDGVHFNTKGNKFFYDTLIDKIYITWPEMNVVNLKQKYPEWNEVGQLNLLVHPKRSN